MRKFLPIGGGVVVAVAIAGAVLMRVPSVDMWLFRHAVTRTVARPAPVLAKQDELSVLLCGTGTPLPDRRRAGPCAMGAFRWKT
jgi:ribonuclease Z